MSSPCLSSQSLQSDQDDSSDSSSTEFSSTVLAKYDTAPDTNNKDFKTTVIISHGVEDILADGVSYVNDGTYQDCKPEVLSAVPQVFSQDYNSRDSTGFSIQDILGLQQPYNPAHVEVLEPRYDYNTPSYENISNSSNNYGSGAEEVITEDCIASDDIFSATPQVVNQAIYNRNYATNELDRYNQRHLEKSSKESTREINDIHESSFPSQVCTYGFKKNSNKNKSQNTRSVSSIFHKYCDHRTTGFIMTI